MLLFVKNVLRPTITHRGRSPINSTERSSPRSFAQRQRRPLGQIAFFLGATCWSSFWFLISMKTSSELASKLGSLVDSRSLHDFEYSITDNDAGLVRPKNKLLMLTANNNRIRAVSSESSSSLPSSKNQISSTSPLPQWMTDYFQWHREQRATLNKDNWDKHKFLIMQCMMFDDKCGGASDRLQVIPTAVLLAYQYQRILLIKWERPAKLEEFLVPPADGGMMDWTIPKWLDKKLKYIRRVEIMSENHFPRLQNNNKTLVQMRYQSFDHGSSYYNEYAMARGEPSFAEIYHACWKTIFEPSPPVQALIDQYSQQLGLIPGQYVSVHARTLYYKDKTAYNDIIYNAVNCASELMPGSTIFVSTDSNKMIKAAVRYGQKQQQGGTTTTTTNRVVARLEEQSPLHLDRGSNFLSQQNLDWNRFPPSAFYDIFVDLYLIAQSACVTVNVGGFGKWGHLIGRPASDACIKNHAESKCEWVSKRNNNTTTVPSSIS